jgi:murein L,D-transpeptidase YafK
MHGARRVGGRQEQVIQVIGRAAAILAVVSVLIVPAACTRAPEPVAPRFAFPGTKADRIVVDKGERRLALYRDGQLLKAYHASLGRQPVGPKRREGDGRTPEGSYVIDGRLARTQFHRALHISYPDSSDRARAATEGVPPGGAILIHGIGYVRGGVTEAEARSDWTEGCIAVTNAEIEEIWAAVDDGTPIDIRP